MSVEFSPDKKKLIVGCVNGTVRVSWVMEQSLQLWSLSLSLSLSIPPLILSSPLSLPSSLCLYFSLDLPLHFPLSCPPSPHSLFCCLFPFLNCIMFPLQVWSLEDKPLVMDIPLHWDAVSCIRYSPQQTHILSVGFSNGLIKVSHSHFPHYSSLSAH